MEEEDIKVGKTGSEDRVFCFILYKKGMKSLIQV